MLLMDKAIREGRGGAHGGLFWYVGDSPRGIDAIRKRLDLAQYHYIKTHGIDPATAKIEVAPGAHYLMGGIQINEHCATSMGGLFATPECAGNVDGANRLAGSGIASTQVFGARAGRTASNWASINSLPEINPLSLEEEQTRITRRILSPGLTGGTGTGAKIFKLRDKLRSAVQLYAGVSRNQQGLTILAKEAKAIQMELADKKVAALKTYNQALLDVLQLETLCEIAGLVAGSALLRDESRGHHFRTDYPLQDDIHWLCHTSSVLSGKDPAFGTKSLQQRS
jgi:succinate dehydrogenase/fumarate reductase flavoprotein subunit